MFRCYCTIIPCVFYFKRVIRKNEIVITRFSFSIYLYREKRSEENDKEIEMKYRPEILLESISFLLLNFSCHLSFVPCLRDELPSSKLD